MRATIRSSLTAVLVLSAAVIVAASPAPARAEVVREMTLDYEKLFSVVCRYIRVDQKGKLIERDKDAGFVIFQWKKDKDSPESRGTIEFIRKNAEGEKPKIDLKLSLDSAPKYLETYFLDGLAKKIKAEYGI